MDASKLVVTCTLSFFSHTTQVLIVPGSTHLFVSYDFVRHDDSMPKPLDFVLLVSTPLSKTMSVEFMCKSCVLKVEDEELIADLILSEIEDLM